MGRCKCVGAVGCAGAFGRVARLITVHGYFRAVTCMSLTEVKSAMADWPVTSDIASGVF